MSYAAVETSMQKEQRDHLSDNNNNILELI